MTYQLSATIGLFLSLFGIACSSSTFDVGSLPDGGGDADLGTVADGGAKAIDPIALLDSWTYDVTVAGTFPECENGTGTSAVSSEATVGGRDAFDVSSFCSGVSDYYYSEVGDEVSEYVNNTWVTALDTPVQDGHTWSNGAETFVWKSAGAVSVTAGTYDDCWEADLQGHPELYAVTFCRGIGPVKWHYRDATGSNGYDAVLTAVNVK